MVWNYPVGMVPEGRLKPGPKPGGGRRPGELRALWLAVPPLSYREMARRMGIKYRSFCTLVATTRIAKEHPVAGRPREGEKPRAPRVMKERKPRPPRADVLDRREKLRALWAIRPPISVFEMSQRLGASEARVEFDIRAMRLRETDPRPATPRKRWFEDGAAHPPRAKVRARRGGGSEQVSDARAAGCVGKGAAAHPVRTPTVWDEDEGSPRLVLERRHVPDPDIARVEGRPVADLRRLMAGR